MIAGPILLVYVANGDNPLQTSCPAILQARGEIMKMCRGLFFVAVVPALALTPLASDSDAQQCGYCPCNANFMTITKQQTTISYYVQLQTQQQQLTYQRQQQQAAMMSSLRQTTTGPGRTAAQVTSNTPVAIQSQPQQQMLARATAGPQAATVCSKTPPQLLTTGTTANPMLPNMQQKTALTQCSFTQHQKTHQSTNTAIQRTNVTKIGTELEVQKTITTTVKVYFDVNCMACHHSHDQPTGTQVAHKTTLPVEQQPGMRWPQVAQQPQPTPMATPPRVPLLAPYVGAPLVAMPSMTAKQAPQVFPISTAKVQPLQPTAMPSPALRFMDLPALLRTADTATAKSTLDPLVVITSLKHGMPIEKLPLLVEITPETGLRSGRSLDLLDQLTVEQPGAAGTLVQLFVVPLPDENLQQPPVRLLSSAVIELAALPAGAEDLQPEAELLPLSAEPVGNRDPLELFGAGVQPARRSHAPVNPLPLPALSDPALPTDRATELTPG
jgi:hypothetical protein